MDADYRFHLYKGEDGKLRSIHSMRNCREFEQMASDYINLRKATAAHAPAPPPVPQPNNVPVLMAPPPPPQPAASGNIVGAIQQVPWMDEPQYPPPQGQMYMIQKGRPSNREQKLRTRQVNMAVMSPPAVTEFLKGSETAISFSREDHPPSVVRPGHSALVLDAQIGGYAMSKVFMDGGSGINIIFTDTLRKMNR